MIAGLCVLGAVGFVGGLCVDGVAGTRARASLSRARSGPTAGECPCNPLVLDSCLAGGGEACLALACVALVASVVFLGALNTLRFFARALRGRVARTVHGLETFALDISEAGDDDDDRPRGSPMTV